MKAEVDRKALADALKEVRKVARKRRGTPEALRCALVRAADSRLWIEATDLDQAIRVPVPAMVFEDGGALVPADLAAEVVGRMPKQAEDGSPAMASLSVLGTVGGATRLRIEVGRVSAIVDGTGAEDYPAIPWAGGDAPRAEADAAALGEAVAAPAIAAAAEDCGRPILCGVCLETDAGAIRAVATDGRRLHCIACPAAARSSAFAAESLRRGAEPAMEIAPENGALSTLTKTPDGEISERVDAADADAWPGAFLNPLYLADALRAAGTGEVSLRGGKSCGVVLVGAVGAPRFAAVMPLRI